jgi:stage II sporulation protein D
VPRGKGVTALLCALAAAAGLAGSARPGSVLVVTGRGWGHGVGMSQWGAYGYALHGWDYRRILAHYYPGTTVGRVGEPRVRVLLTENASLVTVGCASRMSVSDATGLGHPLRAGTYGIGPRLVLPLRRVHRHHHGVAWAGRALRSPVVIQCALNPLLLDGRAYHGRLVLRAGGGSLSVVNSLPLDTYLRGVVGAEMPPRWSRAALEAQAVAARSYAVATLHPDRPFDEFGDERSQMYLGLTAEGPRTDAAVLATAGQIVTYDGRVATTYYSSSSGGRTADIRDLWPSLGPVPYLRPVADPYDSLSPHHFWGPVVLTPARLASRLGIGGSVASLHLEKSPSGRVAAIDLDLASGGSVRVAGKRVERSLKLRSTWFTVGELSLDVDQGRVLFGRGANVVARAAGTGVAVLQRRVGGGSWQDVQTVRGGATIRVEPRATTRYRLSVPGVAGPQLAVAVAPRLTVRPLAPSLLGGTVLPRPAGAVTVWRFEAGGWRLVARPRLDPHGVFRTPLRLRAGGYRVVVAGDERLAGTQASLHVTKRLLASFRR